MDDCPVCERAGGEHWPSCKFSEESEEARESSLRRASEALAAGYVEILKTGDLALWSCKSCASVVNDREVHRAFHLRTSREIESSTYRAWGGMGGRF